MNIDINGDQVKIAVASGKGGTGKTTVSLNMAISLDAQLLDCDVEEPDCHLFLDSELEKVEEVKMLNPKINKDKCNNSGNCEDLCRFNAIIVTPNGPKLFPELCHSCGLCSLGCPENAIEEVERSIGKVEKSRGDLNFYHGELTTGEGLAPPIIESVKDHSSEGIVIIDAPPGNACPAVAALEGTDFAILVTEPTPFGLNDLKYSVRMLDQMEIPYGVVINKAGLGDNRVYEYCDDKNIPILMEIPNKRKIANLYSNGTPFVSEMPEWKEKFVDLYDKIEEMVK